ncbi:MAG: insulinase family protein [Oscillospiraceae bacterium]
MTVQLVRNVLSQGVGLSTLRDEKFKHNRLSVNLIVPMAHETVTENALLPQLLRRGCQSFPDFTQLNRRLDELYGASLVADVNKVGANQIITLGITAIDSRFTLEGEALSAECAALLRDVLLSPLLEDGAFPAQDVALEKQNLIDTIEAQINDKRGYAVLRCRQLMGGDDPCALLRYGRAEAVPAITPSSAANAYHRLIDKAAIELMFTGPGDGRDALQVLKGAFQPRTASFSSPAIVSAAECVRETIEQMDIAQCKLVMGFRTGPRGNLHTQAAFRLMTALFGGTPISKLFLNVRERLGLCYYCAARYDRASATLLVDSGVECQNIDKARTEILRQLEEIQEGHFDDDTLEDTRLQMKNSLRTVGDSASALEDWYLGRLITGDMASPTEDMALLETIDRKAVIAAARAVTLDTVYLLKGKEEA